MSKREFILYLDDIHIAINRIRKYIRGMDYSTFVRDQKTVDAVVRNLEIIGEAACKLPKAFQKENNLIPWRKMIGLRNRVAHEYFGIDMEILWKTVLEDLSIVKKEVLKLMKKDF